MQQEIRTDGGWDSEFRRSLWKGIIPMALGIVVAAVAIRDRDIVMSAIAGVAFMGGALELFWAIREPLLTITPGTIVLRTGYLGRAIEIPRPDVESWKAERNLITINRTGKKPVKIKLPLLRKSDQPRVARLLRAFGYPES